MRKRLLRSAMALLVATAAGCGGSDPPRQPDTFPELAGTWTRRVQGGMNSGYYTQVVVEADGQIWGRPLTFFSPFFPSSLESTLNLSVVFKSQLARDLTGRASAPYSWLTGETCGDATRPCVVFSAAASGGVLTILEESYVQAGKSALAAFVGSWSAMAHTKSAANVTGNVVVQSDGTVSASGFGGCSFNANLVPVGDVRYFKVKLTSVTGSCASATLPSEASGVAFLGGSSESTLMVLWHSSDKSQFFWSGGEK